MGSQAAGCPLRAALEIDSSGTSQHLGVLRSAGLAEGRKERTNVFYRVKDPRTFQLLEVARQILTSHFEESQAILGELSRPSRPPEGRRRRSRVRQGDGCPWSGRHRPLVAAHEAVLDA